MKKTLAAALLVLSIPSYACSFKTSDTENIREIVRQRGGYPVADNVCNFLNQRGLALNVMASSTVLDGASVAWVSISLTKLGTGVVSDTFRYATKVNKSVASQNFADDMLYEGIKESVLAFDFVKAANEVKAYLDKRK